MSDEVTRKGMDAALRPLIASFGPWGVVDAHWLPGRDEEPVVWLTTRTEIERVALQTQPWIVAQVQMMLTRLSVPYSAVSRARLEVTSLEAQAHLFDG